MTDTATSSSKPATASEKADKTAPDGDQPGKQAAKSAAKSAKSASAGKGASKKKTSAAGKKAAGKSTAKAEKKAEAAKPDAKSGQNKSGQSKSSQTGGPSKDEPKAANRSFQDYPIPDMAEMAINLIQAATYGQKAARLLMKNEDNTDFGGAMSDLRRIGETMMEVASGYMRDPFKFVEAQAALWEGYFNLANAMTRRMMGEPVAPLAEPARSDKRFRDPDWQENLVFDVMKQAYLLTAKWLVDQVEQTDGLDKHTRQKADFYMRQLSNAISPSNFPVTNPEILRTTLATNAENLAKGMKHLFEDVDRGHGKLQIQQTDMSAFELGKNIAMTPGKVVYQNDLMQLIQYEPTTETAHKTPLLIFPPWINKYYILDLTPQKSLIKYCVDNGYTVFVASWVNPDAHLAMKSFEDYMYEGVYAALDAVEQATGEKEVNAVGYCIGGTLLACSLAHMAAKGDTRIKSATFLVAQVDFSEAGDLQVFIDEDQISEIEKAMKQKGGYLKGSTMANTFNMLRSNDLIWNYVVNNYMLGREPMPFDILYWNADATRLPAAMHVFYMRQCYLENRLSKGEMVLGGEKLDLTKISIPTYLQSSREDHISPFNSVYKATKLFSGPMRFIVAGSGHIAGVINPPLANKYYYLTNEEFPESPYVWADTAEQHPGSWWPDWVEWLDEKSGDMVPARVPGDGKLDVIEEAPGSYVTVKSED